MAEAHDGFDKARLRRLTQAKCDGVLTDDEIEELSAQLAASGQACDEYWQLIAIHAELQWELGGDATEGYAKVQPLIAITENTVPKNTVAEVAPRRAARSKAARSLMWLTALAACLLIACFGGLVVWRGGRDQLPPQANRSTDGVPSATSAVLGSLTPLVARSNWSVDRAGGNNLSALRQGDTINLSEGAAELRFVTNTVAVLESPVVMQVVAVDRIRLIRGNIKVDVAKGAEGFSVETASAKVIDLGTVFSVNAENGNTDVVVYDGEVDLELPGADVSSRSQQITKRFRAGEAVHVTHDGTLSRIVDVRRTNFSQGESDRRRLIGAVKDNYVRGDFWSFYEIVPRGMNEDARAFVDRPFHEWNGYLSAGMPAYLVGGDYVKTFNDDKVTDDLIIEVDLSQPATLYVLLDERLLPPDWLVQSFTNTGDVIGLDEAPYDPGNPDFITVGEPGVGAGISINRNFRIWKRDVPQGGIVSLGPNGRRAANPQAGPLEWGIEANMYGIVAVPLEE